MTARVRLTWTEIAHGALAGISRRVSAMRRARPEKFANGDAALWDQDINAALAELAVAKALGTYFDFACVLSPGGLADVSGDIEVRHVKRASDSLPVYEKDDPDRRFVLVVGQPPEFEIAGWIPGIDAQRPCFWSAKGERKTPHYGAYMVPASELFPLDDWP